MTDEALKRLALAREAEKRAKPWTWSRVFWHRTRRAMERTATSTLKLEKYAS